jgi:hypothetical protein
MALFAGMFTAWRVRGGVGGRGCRDSITPRRNAHTQHSMYEEEEEEEVKKAGIAVEEVRRC